MLAQALQGGQDVVNLETMRQQQQAAPVGGAYATPVPGPMGAATPSLDHGGGAEGVTEAAFNAALNKLMAATGGKVSVTSGKRSSKRQEELWDQALKKYGSEKAARKWVAKPKSRGGKGSRHESGLAADLKFADDATKALVHKIAAEYGLHFPMDWEPWHIELKGSRG